VLSRFVVVRAARMLVPAAVLLAAATLPAAAQFYGPGPGARIHPQEVEAMVREMGLQLIARPRPRGPFWVAHALDRRGREVRVLVDGFSGRVVDVLRRPTPPRDVVTAPPTRRFDPDDGPAPRVYRERPMPPQAAVPEDDDNDDNSDDEGPNYNDRPDRRGPQAAPPRGPAVIPYDQRGQNQKDAPDAAPKKQAAPKAQKKSNTAALPPSSETPPQPPTRPADAPRKAEAPKANAPRMDAPEMKRMPEPENTGAVPAKPADPAVPPARNLPPVQPLE
jgi:hypothetical protein